MWQLPLFQSPCFYVYSQNTLPLLDEFLEEKKVMEDADQ